MPTIPAKDTEKQIVKEQTAKEEAEKKVKEILENPAKHLDKETRRKALAGKTKGKTSIINLLVRQQIIVEDK